jgi:hypothetical protein
MIIMADIVRAELPLPEKSWCRCRNRGAEYRVAELERVTVSLAGHLPAVSGQPREYPLPVVADAEREQLHDSRA